MEILNYVVWMEALCNLETSHLLHCGDKNIKRKVRRGYRVRWRLMVVQGADQ
jgi:hypothetical protein